jgi:hypothetical protein
MPQQFRMLLSWFVLCAFAGPAFGQLQLLDAGGSPAAAIREGAPLVLRLTTDGTGSTAGASTAVVQVASALTGDVESVTLTETAPDSLVFTGEIALGTGAAVPGDGILETGRSGGSFDTVTASFSSASQSFTASAATVGSATAILGEGERASDVFPVGAGLTLRVLDAAADTTAGADTATVVVQGSGGDAEAVTLRETGGRTGVFTGSLATARGTAVTWDGTLESEPGDSVASTHTDAGGAASTDNASIVRRTLEFVDVGGLPVAALLERDFAVVRLFDRSGTPADLDCRLTSGITGDTETLPLGGGSGVFWNSFPLAVPAAFPAVTGDGLVTTGEGGATDPRDLVTAAASCTDPQGCVTATLPTTDAVLSFLDDHGRETATVVAGLPIHLRASMPKGNTTQQPDTVTLPVSSPGDQKTVSLTETFNESSLFTGSLATSTNPADLGDPARLVIQDGETVTLATPLAAAQALVTAGAVELLDDSGAPVSSFFEKGPVTVRALFPAGDTTPGADTLDVEAVVARPHDAPYDRETLTLTETGAATGIFTGRFELGYTAGPATGNGSVETGAEPDLPQRLQVGFGTHSAAAAPTGSALRLLDAQGADLATCLVGDTVYLRLEDHKADDPGTLNGATVEVRSPETGDLVTLTLTETGTHTGVFTGSVSTQGAATSLTNGTLEVHRGVTIEARHTDGPPSASSGTSSDVAGVQGNSTPTAAADAATTAEDAAVSFNVTANDSDLDGDALTLIATSPGGHGSVVIGSGGSLTYQPAANWNGSDWFFYTVGDGHGGSATAMAQVTVTPVNDPPAANGDAGSTPEDTPVNLSVVLNDSDPDGDVPLSVIAVTQPAHGTSQVLGGGAVRYIPAANYNGGDSFTYTLSDGHGGTAVAGVSVTVTPVNDPPTAVNDAALTREGASVTVAVLANDSDVDGNPLSVTGVSMPGNGAAASLGNGNVLYTPAANFNGVDTFTYNVSDGALSRTATVTVTVKDALERVAVLATNSVLIQTSADVLSGDVIVNQTGSGPFLGGIFELAVGSSVTTPAGWDVEANRINTAAGSNLAGDVYYNQLTNNGAVGQKFPSLALPVFASLPALLAAAPGAVDVNVAINGSRVLTPGSYRDLIVGKNATVTFTGGTYHLRSISADTGVRLLFSAAATVRVQQKVSVKASGTIGPNTGAPVTAAGIVFHVGGVNGMGGALAETPKALEIGTDGVLTANVYAPNGTLWLGDRTQARGSFLAKDVLLGPDVQVTLQTAWTGQ